MRLLFVQCLLVVVVVLEYAGVSAQVSVGVSEGQSHLKQVSELFDVSVNQGKDAGLVQDPAFWRKSDVRNRRERSEGERTAQKMKQRLRCT